ncbi:MAG: hypothetical protein OEZ01_01870 [Candidatus Heimdallarchaeota archaeon]|nr:hypothetical protein [Candidatus Heimdallarchaeota archaeon]MDH5644721.1 hypothetical protein [Candidatus Heimdallarchaeota archaeon]
MNFTVTHISLSSSISSSFSSSSSPPSVKGESSSEEDGFLNFPILSLIGLAISISVFRKTKKVAQIVVDKINNLRK